MKLLWIEVPITLPSVANLRENRWARARRTKTQRNAVTLALKSFDRRPFVNQCWAELVQGRSLTIVLTRIAPTPIRDKHDNLPMALKASVDAIAKVLGVDDGDELVSWEYRQKRGDAGDVGLEIEIFKRSEIAAVAL